MQINKNNKNKITLLQTLLSVLAAFFGVQSSKARERDFSKGKPVHYIIIGLIVVILFVLSIYGVVQWVIANIAHQ